LPTKKNPARLILILKANWNKKDARGLLFRFVGLLDDGAERTSAFADGVRGLGKMHLCLTLFSLKPKSRRCFLGMSF
jgi:hypothetical protein